MTERKCPVCGAALPAKPGFGPFCSKRCQNVDLGRWFTEQYPVPIETDRPLREALDAESSKFDSREKQNTDW